MNHNHLMKAILLLFICLVAISCRLSRRTLGDKSYDLLKGFMDGIQETGNADELKKCLTELDDIVNKLVKAVALIFTYEEEKVKLGISLLREATKRFIDILPPCSEGYVQLKKLLAAYKNADIFDMLRKFLTKPRGYFESVITFLEALKKNNYYVVGLSFGRINYWLYLVKSKADFFSFEILANEADDLLKGFLKGLKETGNFENLRKCLVKLDTIVKAMIKGVEMIFSFEQKSVLLGFLTLVDATSKFIGILENCKDGYEQITKLMDSIKKTDRYKILKKP